MDNENKRSIKLSRKTNETDISISLNLDGTGKYDIETGIGFFNHMLEQLAKHGSFDMELKAVGDISVDCHHTVEDIGILLGKAFYTCLQDKSGIKRYGDACIPMDEALCTAVVDVCGRANLVYNNSVNAVSIGSLDIETIEEFFKAFCSNAFITLHINVIYGKNAHHIVEAIFKAAARALKEAVSLSAENKGILSTKGCL